MLCIQLVSKWAELHLYLFSFAKFGIQIPLRKVTGKSFGKCKCDTVQTIYIRLRVRKYDKKLPWASKLQESPWIQASAQTAANALILCSTQWRKRRITKAKPWCHGHVGLNPSYGSHSDARTCAKWSVQASWKGYRGPWLSARAAEKTHPGQCHYSVAEL